MNEFMKKLVERIAKLKSITDCEIAEAVVAEFMATGGNVIYKCRVLVKLTGIELVGKGYSVYLSDFTKNPESEIERIRKSITIHESELGELLTTYQKLQSKAELSKGGRIA